ncbi:uncharacterized protein LOC133735558 [Rosa rugosa]|uniref:uncharacterized protein LOC133735558 n=1 Tax=Rosa rugosa TaxID=74645 RepID=UPI002B40D719|nr:uncharacterized protein LOC133735558 [Rosa rugosa]
MEECVVIRWKIRRDAKSIYATPFGVFASVIIVILFMWTIWSGFEVAEEPRMNHEYYNNSWAVFGGVLTIVLGFFFLAIGFPILADLFVTFSEQLRNPEESGIHQGGKMKTICIVSRIIVSLIAMLMLVWAIYTGFRLVTEPIKGTYYPLASPVGVVSIMFGVIYFIIGLCTIVELAVELTKRLQGKVKNEIVIHQVHNIDINCFV